MKIRNIEIKNFRGIKELSWSPAPHVNCLIGPGDTGKTTILDAIELALAPRHQVAFDETDFYGATVDNQIAVTVTLGELPPAFKAVSSYGLYTRGWDPKNQEVIDEPDEGSGLELVLSARLTVDRTLEPKWRIYTDRNVGDSKEYRTFRFEDRQAMAPTRVGVYTDRHLGWGRQSVLTRLSGKARVGEDALAEAVRAARTQFAAGGEKLFQEVVGSVNKFASLVGVKLGPDVCARLDVQGISLNSGGISLHDGDLPLRLLGAGSSRLLVAALQDQAGESAPFALIDEVEHGLEPHRISRLLRYLKSARTLNPPQLFLTTHSPVVLEELSIGDMAVVRRDSSAGKVIVSSAEIKMGDFDPQAQLRSTPSAYLARSIMVCEGDKTEVGLFRGLDQYWALNKKDPFATAGVAVAPGRGKDRAPVVAKYFRKLSYRVALFLDSDREPDDGSVLTEIEELGVTLIRWDKGKATEDVLFGDLGDAAVTQLVQLLRREGDPVTILNQANSLTGAQVASNWADLENRCTQSTMRAHLATCAKKFKWIKKNMTLAELVGLEVFGPHLNELGKENTACITKLRTWIESE